MPFNFFRRKILGKCSSLRVFLRLKHWVVTKKNRTVLNNVCLGSRWEGDNTTNKQIRYDHREYETPTILILLTIKGNIEWYCIFRFFLEWKRKTSFLANNPSGLVFICSCLEWHIYAVCIGPGNYLLVPIILAKYLEIMLENKALIEPLRIFGVSLFVLCDINTWPRNLLSLKRMKISE